MLSQYYGMIGTTFCYGPLSAATTEQPEEKYFYHDNFFNNCRHAIQIDKASYGGEFYIHNLYINGNPANDQSREKLFTDEIKYGIVIYGKNSIYVRYVSTYPLNKREHAFIEILNVNKFYYLDDYAIVGRMCTIDESLISAVYQLANTDTPSTLYANDLDIIRNNSTFVHYGQITSGTIN